MENSRFGSWSEFVNGFKKKINNVVVGYMISCFDTKSHLKEHIARDFGENSSLDFTQEKENEEHARGIDQ